MADLFDEPLPAPADGTTLATLAHEAEGCRRCPLYRDATQVVFGEGRPDAPLMLVGEQPGDHEDLAGRPFVGPAGRVLNRALEEARIDRTAAYVTNAVKHFKHELRGKRRLHKTPDRGEIEACRWWLDREQAVLRPRLTVALGGTAALALTGRPVVITRTRGRALTFADGSAGLITIHPSAVLRQIGDEARDEAYRGLVHDLAIAAKLLAA